MEVKQTSRKRLLSLAGIGTGLLVVALAVALVMDQFMTTPQEVALMDENQALQEQLDEVSSRISEVAGELEGLKSVDQNLYRSLLQAEPISDDVLQAGVGGSNPYEDNNRYSPATASLLTQTSDQIESLERQMGMQSDSFRELIRLASDREKALLEMPAIVPSEGAVVSGYGLRDHPVLKVRRMHYGIDVAVWTGTEVVATGDGVIKAVGRGGSLGIYVKVEHPNAGYISVYGHLSKVPSNIRRGVEVKRGDLIAYSGNTGLSAAPHLHYEIHDKNGRALNPLAFLAPSMTPSAYQKLVEETNRSTVSLD